MALAALIARAFKVVNLQDPREQICKSDAIDLALSKVISKSLVEFHRYVLMICPVDRKVVYVLKSHMRLVFVSYDL